MLDNYTECAERAQVGPRIFLHLPAIETGFPMAE